MLNAGLLKHFSIDNEGSFIDGIKVSDVKLEDIHLKDHHSIRVRIGVKEDSQYVGGMNIFGKGFGNYDQGIILKTYY